jgi:hypothetical protein
MHMRALSVSFLTLWASLSPLIAAHTFTDRAGRSITADIVAKQGDQIRIKRADGQEFTLAITALSPADQQYAKDWQPATAAPASAPASPAANGRAKAGTVVALEFPNLPKDHNGNPATCNVSIPNDYDPAKPVPLLVWIAGGKGGNMPGGGFALVDKAHWAVAALPYPSTAPTPADSLADKSNMDIILGYHKTMLEEVVKLLPNLDPKLRVVVGFSNGAHTIGTNIARGEKEFTELFNAFVIIEGGGDVAEARKKLRGKYAYLAWGNDIAKKGSKDYMGSIRECVKDAKLETSTHEMDGVGHSFPDSEKVLVKEWIAKTVVPGLSAATKK